MADNTKTIMPLGAAITLLWGRIARVRVETARNAYIAAAPDSPMAQSRAGSYHWTAEDYAALDY